MSEKKRYDRNHDRLLDAHQEPTQSAHPRVERVHHPIPPGRRAAKIVYADVTPELSAKVQADYDRGASIRTLATRYRISWAEAARIVGDLE